jgi:hypothetical protein
MSDETPKLRVWWTTDGRWEHHVPPDAWLAADAAETDFSDALRAAGYDILHKVGDSGDFITDVEIETWAHSDGHLFVIISDCAGLLAEFFVSRIARVPFVVDKLPDLIRSFCIGDMLNELRTIRRAIVAWVRHGEGEDTIDQYGEATLDDRRRLNRLRQARRDAEIAKAAKP